MKARMPGQVLCLRGLISSPRVSELVVVISVDDDVMWLCATGNHAGRMQTVTHVTAYTLYDTLASSDGAP